MISVIIPFLNEEQSLTELYQRLTAVLKKEFEIIFVNDGSTDNSLKVVQELAEKDGRIRLINFIRNKGKSAALTAGFKKARGEIIITMDADLQDQPEEINKLLEKLKDGYDLVSGWKKKRYDKKIIVYFSRLFNWIIRKTTKLQIHDINCGFKAYRREVAENLSLYGDLYRFIPILAAKEGFKIGETEISHALRRYGRSKYGFSKFFKGFFDLTTVLFLINFKTKPFRLFGTAGISLFGLGSAILVYLTAVWFSGESIGRRPLLIFGMLLVIVGIQLFSLGLMAELLVSVKEGKKKDD
ncbi:glycosyltransferase [Candidatus Shapirobacteria bacterium CG03_land_8_20_14_0_80_40_19]|uniref:Glycosyltransferase n=3 Tax=Candidatus Shapironibacteriota TaxID=1752721 RepID=A0A2M7BEB8_9BACT|nr:MAG: glycosyltransferase [Candidatus Shapirobacteria bacterium CG11_big_fil_rev_8_21_14_0_20_40_12]PIV01429.1 MAG: glycosyltransferase [Candidatus Shapirobacteria bacterium CG03_land_8_20_14_0_80_40_19]PJC77002.1 MAG: glycosyltransferase [Candidatus Shapirobacteria bacterium CG_4_8_14_3_um_filter_39_11]